MGPALSEKDVNVPVQTQDATAANNGKPSGAKALEYHRQMLQSKMADEKQQQYISPSDSIMSPATAKLNALKGRVAGRIKPKSLFAQTSAKKLDGNDVFGAKGAKGAQESKESKDPPTEDQSRPSQ